MESKKEKFNIKDWIVLSTTMIGIVLTILALIWQSVPSSGIVVATFLLMLSFILFVNSVSANSKAAFEARNSEMDIEKIKHFVSFAEYTFGLGFTLVIVAFALLGYKYLIDFIGKTLITFILPISFLLTAWILIMIYNSINYSEKGFKILRSLKRNIWIFMELGALVVITLDYLDIFIIP
ncbi:MAG: hypothetical protein EU521_00200 [Promethearchaeota archaeon]|nr:MAG: hypothetical protein EU521_00200 [Candidatus Lokiarchaeota archaeon]